jgi:organic hydroperoxide reductase OsmC/OhrA
MAERIRYGYTSTGKAAMTEHRASVQWDRRDHAGDATTYSRDHALRFENGQVALGSAAPDFMGNSEALNPETLLVGALASCHMLTFLAVAAKRGYVVETYADDASGTLGKNEQGRMAIVACTLRPRIMFSGEKQPGPEELAKLHERAHDNCFIANSIRCAVGIET